MGFVAETGSGHVLTMDGAPDAAKPEKVEKKIMAAIPSEHWNECGMAISFLGREICRPTNPKCLECPVNSVCQFFQGSGR
jgi:endonuclease-3